VQTSTGFLGIELSTNPFVARNLSLRIQASMKRYNVAIHQCRRSRVAAWNLNSLAAWRWPALVTMLTCGFCGFVMGVIGLIENIVDLAATPQDFKATYIDAQKEWF